MKGQADAARPRPTSPVTIRRRLSFLACSGVVLGALVAGRFWPDPRPAPLELTFPGPFTLPQKLATADPPAAPVRINQVAIVRWRGFDTIRVHFDFTGPMSDERLLDLTWTLKDAQGHELARQSFIARDARLNALARWGSWGTFSLPTTNLTHLVCPDGTIGRAATFNLRFEERPRPGTFLRLRRWIVDRWPSLGSVPMRLGQPIAAIAGRRRGRQGLRIARPIRYDPLSGRGQQT